MREQAVQPGELVIFEYGDRAVDIVASEDAEFVIGSAVPHPHDLVTTAIAQELVPAGKKTDWTGFYGFGGGYDLNATKHIAIRMQTDVVWFHVFNDLLKDGRWDISRLWGLRPMTR